MKAEKFKSLYSQILFTLLAFGVMVVLSYLFNSKTVRDNITRTADNVLSFTHQQIEAELVTSKLLLGDFTQTARQMILDGNAEYLQHYINIISSYIISNETGLKNINGLYGYFENVFSEDMLMVSASHPLPEIFVPTEQEWYKRALANCGEFGETEPYKDPVTGEYFITYSHCIHDDCGGRIGVACIDVPLHKVGEIAVNAALIDGGYGALAARDLTMFAHANPDYVGRRIYEPALPIAQFAADFEQGRDLYERRMENWKGEDVIVFSRKLPNGWHLILLTPEDLYYHSTSRTLAVLCVLGAIMAAALCMVLIKIDRARIKADEESRQKSAFLANMSHEIRTPMNAILGIAEVQLQEECLSPDITEAFSKIYESGELLLNIINDILDLSKIESGKFEMNKVKYDIPSLINDTAQLNRLRFESKPIVFTLVVDENTPLTLYGDELRIKQVLNNILSNAFKYTDEGTVEFSVYAEQGNDEYVTLVLRVSDSGQGMAEDEITRIFDEYTRFNLETNRSIAGVGLGMSISKHLIDMMNGSIMIESKPGKGTVFTIRIPQKRAGAEICGAELAEKLQNFDFKGQALAKKAQFLREYMPYGSILVVDDMESNIYVARGMLTPYGLKIDIAYSAHEAIKKIQDGNVYDIIFMDHMMPVMNGIEAVKLIRSMGYQNTIIALTANTLIGQAQYFLENGFDGFLSKPIDSRELNHILNNFIRNRKPVHDVESARKEQFERKYSGTAAENLAAEKTHEIQGGLSDREKFFLADAEHVVKVLSNLHAKLPALDDGETELYAITAHGIKNVLADFNEKDLSGLALKLEQAGGEKNFAVMADETPVLLNALQCLINRLKPAREEAADESKKADLSGEDIAFLREKLLVIKTACLTFDTNAAKTALYELKQKNWPAYVNNILDEISKHILHSSFKKAVEATDNLTLP